MTEDIRSDCGTARVAYHPEWSETLPWVTYRKGTAGQQFPTAERAVAYLYTKWGIVFRGVKKTELALDIDAVVEAFKEGGTAVADKKFRELCDTRKLAQAESIMFRALCVGAINRLPQGEVKW